MSQKVLLRAEHIQKYFPIKKGLLGRFRGYVKAVDDVSFDVFEGETLGIVGESGCGKSTLGRCLLSLIPLTSGQVLFRNQNIQMMPPDKLREQKANMQIVFQDPYGSLNPRFKVWEIIAEPLIAHDRMKGKELRPAIARLMEDVGLNAEYMDRYPHEFSGGQRQRISIARSLALNPQFIVCDEAVSALDVSTQSQVLNLLKKLQKKYGLTYFFISHNLSVVNYISDRVGVMYLGKIVEMANVDELYGHYLHPYTQALLSAIPSIRTVAGNRIILGGDVPSPTNPPQGCAFHPRCSRCKEKCRTCMPSFRQVEENHWVACHFPL